MAGQALHVFEGNALLQEIGNCRDAEGMRDSIAGREASRNLRFTIRHTSTAYMPGRELAGFANGGAEEGSVFRCVLQACGSDVWRNRLLQIVANQGSRV